jgi:hypothetical protein
VICRQDVELVDLAEREKADRGSRHDETEENPERGE